MLAKHWESQCSRYDILQQRFSHTSTWIADVLVALSECRLASLYNAPLPSRGGGHGIQVFAVRHLVRLRAWLSPVVEISRQTRTAARRAESDGPGLEETTQSTTGGGRTSPLSTGLSPPRARCRAPRRPYRSGVGHPQSRTRRNRQRPPRSTQELVRLVTKRLNRGQ